MTTKEKFKEIWILGNDDYKPDDFDTVFANHSNYWFDSFMQMYEYMNSNPDVKINVRYFMQNPKYEVVNDEQWSTLSWNVSWIHADFKKQPDNSLTNL